jgi:hypothetical protein
MKVRRFDQDTVSLEEDDVSIILYYPTSMSDAEIIEQCRVNAERLEKRVKLYRDFIQSLE